MKFLTLLFGLFSFSLFIPNYAMEGGKRPHPEEKKGEEADKHLNLKKRRNNEEERERKQQATLALFAAAQAGNIEDARHALEENANFAFTNEHNQTLAQIAREHGHEGFASWLEETIADIIKSNQLKLSSAIQDEDLDAIDRAAADMNPAFISVSLLEAIGNEKERQKVVALLLARGAYVNVCDHRGAQAIHEAVARGHFTTVITLLAHGANLNAQDEQGFTPFDYVLQDNGLYCHRDERGIGALFLLGALARTQSTRMLRFLETWPLIIRDFFQDKAKFQLRLDELAMLAQITAPCAEEVSEITRAFILAAAWDDDNDIFQTFIQRFQQKH